ncbi:MAG: heavy-metal-associated domain-containing protein [Sulfuricurvum sp.]|jgi:copper chaperone CopZ|uniref:heavy-metal-associated domain-containing protein n=1 Tax=Sulfuricurvum sp. TaxID=2025608 RepID=UPI0025DAD70D|nr:heavy-metal-associated domain-containing protein [Sulfuricurvum sp.]MCK9372124.1 heavy-metal-associated domain-containing protein [Sulfuricurvum sp.]
MTEIFEVDNIRCGGCANTITKALEEAGFQEVSVDTTCEPRTVTATIADEAQLALFKSILIKLGYPLSHSNRGLVENTILKAKSFVSCATGKIN